MKKYLAIAGAGLMMIGTAGMAAAATIDVGGEIRIRYENRENVQLNNNTSDNVHGTTQRTRVNVNAKVSDEISAFIQLQNVRTWGSNSSANTTTTDTAFSDGTTNNGTTTDTHQAYLQVNKVFGTPLSVRLGRQELSYGNERLVGALNWSQIGRSFDAAKVMYKSSDIDVDVWASKLNERTTQTDIVSETAARKGSDNDMDFYGIWATYKGIKDNTIDLYALVLRDGGAGVFANTATPNVNAGAALINGINYGDPDGDGTVAGANKEGAALLYTLGARLKGAVGSFDYEAELDYQTGDTFNGTDVDAMAYAVTLGYTLPVDMSPRISVEYVNADGDDNSTDGDVETFNQLFPTGHKHLGYADLVGYQNVEAWRLGASIKPTKALFVSVDYWNFQLNEDKDAWYRANGSRVIAPVTAGSTNVTDDEIGNEIDVIAKYKYADNLSLEAGYSLFQPGDLVQTATRGAGAGTKSFADDDDQTWVYGMVTLTF